MFEHLSDPNPPVLGDGLRHGVIARARRRQRRVRVTAGTLVLAPLVALAGGVVYFQNQANELERIEVAGLVPAASLPPTHSDPSTGPEPVEEIPPLATPLNILVVGVDRRPPGSDVRGTRADTIAVVRIEPDRQRVGVLSVPRDLWVTRADGTSGRLNSFTDDGGLVEVLSSVLGLEINHYVEVDFEGFQALINLAGGITVPFDTAVRDEQTGFTAPAGCSTLSGTDALAYVRSRRLEALDPATGQWTPDPRADLGRISRQQDLMRRMLSEVLSHDYTATDKARLIADVIDDVTVDPGLDLTGLQAIFNATALIGVDNFAAYDLNSTLTAQLIEDNSVLVAEPAGIQAEVERFLSGSTTAAGSDQLGSSDDAIVPPPTGC